MQAIVIPWAVPEQKWRRPVLPGLVAAREITCVIAGIGCGDVHALVPAIGDLSERRIKSRAQNRDEFRQRIGEIFVLAPPKTMSRHDDPTAKGSVRCVARGELVAFARCQQRSGRGAAMRVECLRNLRPVECGDAGGERWRRRARTLAQDCCRRGHKARSCNARSRASNARLRATPQR